MVDKAVVSPELVRFPVPCWGKKKEMKQIEIKNDSDEKLTFKMKVTHQDRFQVEPAFGFVDAKATSAVNCRPRPFDDLAKSNHEHFTVLLHVVPKEAKDVTIAKSIWKHGSPYEPTKPKRYIVKIEYFKKEKKDKSQKKKKEKKVEQKNGEPKKEEPKKEEPKKVGSSDSNSDDEGEGDEDEDEEGEDEEDEDETEDEED